MSYQTIRDINLKDQTIIVRTDYNVPLKNGQILSDFRIKASLPTLNYLREQGAKRIILISHLGRPEGKENPELSLSPIAKHLASLLPNVQFINQVSGPAVENAVKNLPTGGILLLENLRFNPGEEANSADFIQKIIKSVQPDLFVQDGFAVIHRAHASTSKIADFLPVYAGLLLEKELTNLTKISKNPKHPLTVVIGGAKVDDKAPLIERFSALADHIIIGGKIAADGYQPDSEKIYISEDFDEDSAGQKLDIGPLATAKMSDLVSKSQTVIWNGLLGKAEDPAYATASTVLAELLGENPNITSVILGGDTTGFVEELLKTHPKLNFSLLSTGGGAALEFLSDKPLPGLAAIKTA